MSSGLFFSRSRDYSNPKEAVLQKIFKILIVVLSFILVLELVYHFLLSPFLVIKDIRVTAVNGTVMERQELLEYIGYNASWTFFSIDCGAIREKIMQHPAVKDVSVGRIFPDSLRITITKRSSVGLSIVPDAAGRSIPLLFDDDGIVFEIGTDGLDLDYPVISGVSYPDAQLGMRLPEELTGFLKSLKILYDESPRLLQTISELRFIKREYGSYEVLLFPVHEKVRIRLGTELNETLLKHIIMVLDIVKSMDTVHLYEEIDLRTGDPVYRFREDRSAG